MGHFTPRSGHESTLRCLAALVCRIDCQRAPAISSHGPGGPYYVAPPATRDSTWFTKFGTMRAGPSTSSGQAGRHTPKGLSRRRATSHNSPMHRAAMLLLVATSLALALLGAQSPRAQAALSKPGAPLAVVAGNSVQLSWRLPASPRPLNVILYRGDAGGPLSRLATLEAERRSFTDNAVSVGQAYDYAIALDQRGLPLSAMSPSVRVSIGAMDRVVFRGGSISRAVFDVAVFSEGRKIVESFVAAPGEVVGDLRRIDGVEKPLDFRLGCKVIALRLEIAPGRSNERQPILDSAGQALTDLAGRPLELTLPAKGESRERLVAELEAAGGRRVTLQEGEGFSP